MEISQEYVLGRIKTLESLIMYAEIDLATGKFEDVKRHMEAEIFTYRVELQTLCYLTGYKCITNSPQAIYEYINKQ